MQLSSFVWLGPLMLAAASTGCAANQARNGQECTPLPDGAELEPSARAGNLAGLFRVILVGTSADYSDQLIEGTLALHPQDSALQSVALPGGVPVTGARMPLYGSLDAAIEQVGGMRLGSAVLLDPAQPGVAVLEQVAQNETGSVTSITMRVGSDANHRDMVRFDGGFMALYVKEITPGGFRGTWASGVRGPEHEGYFCAFRLRNAADDEA
ncbi:MAG: hypothetical protein HKM89_02615 [Gemmatimonadales bacterium]|nr:hypothetical protein [Gemmatimonadales bacterium]